MKKVLLGALSSVLLTSCFETIENKDVEITATLIKEPHYVQQRLDESSLSSLLDREDVLNIGESKLILYTKGNDGFDYVINVEERSYKGVPKESMMKLLDSGSQIKFTSGRRKIEKSLLTNTVDTTFYGPFKNGFGALYVDEITISSLNTHVNND